MGCSESDYDYLRQVVLSRSANLVAPSRNTLFETRLKPIARLAGASNLGDFVGLLRTDPTERLHSAVAEAMTINETSFFRDRKLFDVLRDTILPRLIEAKASQQRLRIWSAACSTGQEAYSVAMLIREGFADLAGWDIKIVGTDISHRVIDYAARARYRRLEVNRGLPARMLVKFLVRDEDEWSIVPAVRSMCEFRYLNVCGPLPKLPSFDLVLLRNVLLYFTVEDRKTVFRGVHRQMEPSGYLVLGASEQAEDSTALFQSEFAKEYYFYRPARGT